MKTRLLTVFLLFATFNTYARLSDQGDTLHMDFCKDLVSDKMLVQSNIKTYKRTFIDKVGKNTLQVEIYNPCMRENPPWDAEKCTIEASLTNAKGNVKLFYNHPDSQMSLIYFDDKEIVTPKINGSTAVIIPFYYCGNSEESDKPVSYIIIYNQKKYIYHFEYRCTDSQDCKPKVKLNITLNSLPSPLKTYLVTYLTAKHKAIKSFHQE